jgi:hypothetical protein
VDVTRVRFDFSGTRVLVTGGTSGIGHAIARAFADAGAAVTVTGRKPAASDYDVDLSGFDYRTLDVQDAAAMVRDYTKWDDTPVSLGHFAASAVRAYKLATTPAMGPVVLVADAVLQEEPIPEEQRSTLAIPKLSSVQPPAADPSAIGEVARLLVAAENPVIVAGRCARTPDGIRLLVELAETLQAPVNDRPFRFRMNFPTRHPLYGVGTIADGDVVLGLEVSDFWQATHAPDPGPVPVLRSAHLQRLSPGAALHGAGLTAREASPVPATFSNMIVLPTNRLTYTPSVLLAYTQVGIINRVRGMLPTQQGQVCHGARPTLASRGFV